MSSLLLGAIKQIRGLALETQGKEVKRVMESGL